MNRLASDADLLRPRDLGVFLSLMTPGFELLIHPWFVARTNTFMSRPDDNRISLRASKFETLEPRLAMSANALTEVALGAAVITIPGTDQVVTMGDDAQFQQVANIRQQYGFTGSGQTVAVIDTGIAWDHVALGGGFGAGHKVVGGWDFAENDANPYDDGPFGFHGTHVAGIVGNTDATRYGVASGVDLVALRVFNDNGVSDFKWVEQALQWVHQHKGDFANPITTINLSVGTRTNLNSLPALATLEDEFAQLEADGIFISVAAGNAFKSYNAKGLTYPAISPNIVAVASHDANGSLSDFSQRADQVLVAPGRGIISTVPNHIYAGMQTNGFMTGTGTSMASPYVAGASALLREAMTFMGYQNINQDSLYSRFRETADRLYDSATSSFYSRINVGAAIDAIVRDDHSDSAASPTQLGSLSNQITLRGTIGKVTDVDQFAFTAAASGTVTLTLSSTHDLSSVLGVNGVTHQFAGRQVTFSVQAGQKYVLSLGTSDSIGHYDAALQLSKSVAATQWGTVGQRVIENLSVQGEQWYQLNAGRAGVLTIEGLHTAGVSKLELYNDKMQLVATASTTGNNLRLDHAVQQGESFFVRVVGTSNQLDVRVTNLVSLNGGLLNIDGTAQADSVRLSVGDSVDLTVNDVTYQYGAASVSRIDVAAKGGDDQIHVAGSQADDWFRMDVGRLRMTNSQLTIDAQNFEHMTAVGRGGVDLAIAIDSNGNDVLTNADGWVRLKGEGFDHLFGEFERTRVVSRIGNDQAFLNDSKGDDILEVRNGLAVLRSNGRVIVTDRFEQVTAIAAQGGSDHAMISDTMGDDRVVLKSGYGSLNDVIKAFGWETIEATSSIGNDTVVFEVSDGIELRTSPNGTSQIICGVNSSSAADFETVMTIIASDSPLGPSALVESVETIPVESTHSQLVPSPTVALFSSFIHRRDGGDQANNLASISQIEGSSIVLCHTASPSLVGNQAIEVHAANPIDWTELQQYFAMDRLAVDDVVDKVLQSARVLSGYPFTAPRVEMSAVDNFYRDIGN